MSVVDLAQTDPIEGAEPIPENPADAHQLSGDDPAGGTRRRLARAAERARLSFPTSATEAARRPQSGPPGAPQARTSMHMPGQSHRGPGNDGPGVSR